MNDKVKSLKDLRAGKGTLSIEKALPIVIQIAEALSNAHNSGIVHGAIQPSNILVDSTGRVKVIGFGNTEPDTAGATSLAQEYMSPEQCEGCIPGKRSDIYSLGVVLYELLTGGLPYTADTPAGLLMKILKGELKSMVDVMPSVPTAVATILQKMLNRDRSKRYSDASEVALDLKICLHQMGAMEALATLHAGNELHPDDSVYMKKVDQLERRVVLGVFVILGGICVLAGLISYVLWGMNDNAEPTCVWDRPGAGSAASCNPSNASAVVTGSSNCPAVGADQDTGNDSGSDKME